MDPIIVDTNWLAERLDDPDMVVIDVRQPYFYGQGHVPGAVNLPDYYLSGPGGAPPDADDLAQRLGELGVTRSVHIVACDDGGSYSAARLFWVLRYYRHPEISVLDGGITRWRNEGRDWEYTAAPASPAPMPLLIPSILAKARRPGPAFWNAYRPSANSLPMPNC